MDERRVGGPLGAARLPLPVAATLALMALAVATGCGREGSLPTLEPLVGDAGRTLVGDRVGDAAVAAQPEAPAATEAEAEPANLEPVLPPLATVPLVRRLPRHALAAGAIAAPRALDRALDLRRQIAAVGAPGAALRELGRDLTGLDVADVGNWPRLSVDPDQPVGFALLELDPIVVAVGWHSADIEQMRTLFHVWAADRHPLREFEVGPARLISRHDGVGPAFGWQGEEAWMVFGDDLTPGEALYHARALAEPVDEPLVEWPAFTDAVERVELSPSGQLVVNTPALVQRGLRTAAEDPKIGRLSKGEALDRRLHEFERANRKSLSRLRLQSLDLISRARTSAEEHLLRAATYAFGPAAFEIRLHPREIHIQLAQPITIGALPIQALHSGLPADVALPLSTDGLGSLRLRFDPDVMLRWIRGLLVIANRGELVSFATDLRARAGVDLQRDGIDQSPGELTVALLTDPERPLTLTGLGAVLEITRPMVRWRIRDADAIDRTLRRLARTIDELEPAGPQRYAIRWAGMPQLWLRVEDDALRLGVDGEAPADLRPAPIAAETPTPISAETPADAGPTPADGAPPTASDAGPTPADGAPPADVIEGALVLRLDARPARLAEVLVETSGALPAVEPTVGVGRAAARAFTRTRLTVSAVEDGVRLDLTLSADAPLVDVLARATAEAALAMGLKRSGVEDENTADSPRQPAPAEP